jgi:hypothetical protein
MSEFIESLPEDIREGDHWEGIDSFESLATKYHQEKTTPFSDTLPEDLREHEALKDMTPDKLAKQYVETVDKVPQVPKSADEYQNIDIPEGIPFDEAANQVFKETALEAGFTNEQYQQAMKFDLMRLQGAIEQLEAQRRETVAQVAKENNISEDAVSTKVSDVAKKLGLDELTERLDLTSDPLFIRAMMNISSKISEDTLKFGSSSTASEPRLGADGRPILQYKTFAE